MWLPVKRTVAAGVIASLGLPACSAADTGFIDIVSNDKPPPPKPKDTCDVDGQCPPMTPYCDQTKKRCIECIADPNCAGGPMPVCGPAGACVQCLVDATCAAATPHCAADHACVECLDDAHCPTGEACDTVKRRCVPTCAGNGDCAPMTPYCDLQRLLCVECVGDANCAVPRPYCNIATSKCVECTTDQNCAAGQMCDPMQHCAP